MRDSRIIDLRPKLDHIISSKALPHEVFQNMTLRPILKLQHPITSALLDTNAHFKKLYPNPSLLTPDQYTTAIETFVKGNKDFRSQIIGVIIGMMTLEEYNTYLKSKSEYNKRLISMQVKRYVDSRDNR